MGSQKTRYEIVPGFVIPVVIIALFECPTLQKSPPETQNSPLRPPESQAETLRPTKRLITKRDTPGESDSPAPVSESALASRFSRTRI